MKYVIWALGCIALIGIIAYPLVQMDYGYPEEIACMVEDKWVETSGGESKTLVSCGGETFIVKDLLFMGKFNSSDIYASVKVGKNNLISVTGQRVPFLSHYRNINKVEILDEEE